MLNGIKKFFYRTDWVLLGLCIAASIYGIIMVASSTNFSGGSYYYTRQLISLMLGLGVFFVISFIDMELIAEHQVFLLIFATLFLGALGPFGVQGSTGNRSWLQIPGISFMIQPAEYCKLVYIIVIARIMTVYQERINSAPCIIKVASVSALFLGLIVIISEDAGVALIYVFTFIIMALAGGFSFLWFIGAGIVIAVVTPILWNSGVIRDDQKTRIMLIFDESIDPNGIHERYQTKHSINAISGGGFSGQGLFEGTQTQVDNIPAQHTDFIFSVIGEELGFLGCLLCILLLAAIILRCIWVGVQSGSFFHRCLCLGVAGTLLFQVIVNVGMCIGVTPVIGLTLPFFSYGGSSMISLYMAMGVISSVRMHPSPDSRKRYLELPI